MSREKIPKKKYDPEKKTLKNVVQTLKSLQTRRAEDIQDEIFRKMPVPKKLRLASDFSVFLSELNKLNS